PFDCEFRSFTRRGDVRWVHCRSAPRALADGQVAWDGVVLDVTDRKRAEEALRDAQRFVERVARTTPAVLFVFDLDLGRNVYANRDVGEELGYRPGASGDGGREFLARVMDPDDFAALGDRVRAHAALDDGAVSTTEYRMRHADGSWRWRRAHLTVFARRADGS